MCELLSQPETRISLVPPGEADATKTPVEVDTSFKTSICRNFQATGTCRYDRLCMYAHGNAELRSSEMNVRDGLTTPSAIRTYQMSMKNRFGGLSSGTTPLAVPLVGAASGVSSTNSLTTPQGSYYARSGNLTPGATAMGLSPACLPASCVSNNATPLSMTLPLPAGSKEIQTYSMGDLQVTYLPSPSPSGQSALTQGSSPSQSSSPGVSRLLDVIQGKSQGITAVSAERQEVQPNTPDSKRHLSYAEANRGCPVQWYNITPTKLREVESKWTPAVCENSTDMAPQCTDIQSTTLRQARKVVVTPLDGVDCPPQVAVVYGIRSPVKAKKTVKTTDSTAIDSASHVAPTMPSGAPSKERVKSFDLMEALTGMPRAAPAGQVIALAPPMQRGATVSLDMMDDNSHLPYTACASMLHTPYDAPVRPTGSVTPPPRQANNKKDATSGGQDTSFKTLPCRNFETTGTCRYDRLCMYAHGNAELRTGEMNVRDGLTTPSAIRTYQNSTENRFGDLHRASGKTPVANALLSPALLSLTTSPVPSNFGTPLAGLLSLAGMASAGNSLTQQPVTMARPSHPAPEQPSPSTFALNPKSKSFTPSGAAKVSLLGGYLSVPSGAIMAQPIQGKNDSFDMVDAATPVAPTSPQQATAAPVMRRMPTVKAVVSKPMTRDNNSFDMIDGSSSSPVKGACEAPRSHKEALEGHLEYAECPADLKWDQSTAEALAAAAGAHGSVVVLSDLRSGTTAAEVRWTLKSAAGVEVVKAEPKGHAGFTISLATAAGVHAVRRLEGTLLCDRKGFWLARTGDEIDFLEEYTSTKLAKGAGGLPKSSISVAVERRAKH